MRLTLVGLLLFASTALGQTVTFSGTNVQDNEIVVSKAQCTLERAISFTRAGALCEKISIWISNADCSGDPGTDDLLLREFSTTDTVTQGTETFTAAEVLERASKTCETQTENQTFKICATTRRQRTDVSGGCEATASSVGTPTINFILDPKAPNAPAAPTASGLDEALLVTVTAPSDSARILVEVRQLEGDPDGGTPGAGAVVSSKEQTTDNLEFRMEGLENDVEYSVQAFAIDKAGNQSEGSPTTTGTPVGSYGFYEEYLNDGGSETGGCGAAGGGLAAGALAVFGFWLSRRKQS
ncbi:MXAN_2561 family MXYO-CTERM-anchored protein [Pyxidicoccus sp. 3LG]